MADAVMDDSENAVATASATYTPAPPTVDTTPPTVTITPMFDATTSNVVFTITFADAAGISGTLTYGNISVVNGTVIGDPVATTAGVYTVTVTPTDSEQRVVLTVAEAAVTDASAETNDSLATSGTYTPRELPPPVVTFASTGDATVGMAFTVTITPDTGQTVVLSDITVTQTASDGTQSVLSHTYNGTTGEVTFTPTAAGTVIVVAKDVDSDPITVGTLREIVALTATAAAATVNGSTAIVVTLSATAPATVPADLTAADFMVMEGTTALTPVRTANTLTITPEGTGDTTVTVNVSQAGMAKISFAEVVSVMVDRTAPAVMFSEVTGAKSNVAVIVTITVTGAAPNEVVAVGDITVTQTLDDNTASVLAHTYNAGVVTFTPTAVSTVVVTVDAGAVMDAVGNTSAEASSGDIAVAAADLVDSTGPTAVITGGQGTPRAFEVTITFNEALKAGETLAASEITVTGGTIANVAAHATTANAFTGMVTPNHGVAAVTVQVNAGAVKDASDNANVATPATATSIPVRMTSEPPAPPATDPLAGTSGYSPLITIPGGGENSTSGAFIVVVRDKDAANTRGLAFRSNVTVVEWAEMPDLRELFDKNAPGGGGAIVLRTSATQPDSDSVAVGTVGISEIMWSIDLGVLGNEANEIASQWIELHNLNKHAAKVLLYHLTGTAITGDTNIRGDLAAPTVDAVTNFFNNRPGNEAWDVPGSNGNTVAGVNFVSMARVVPGASFDLERTHKDKLNSRFNNKDGRAAGSWQASSTNYILASTGTTNVVYYYVGTPGRVNSFKPATQGDLIVGRTSVPSDKVIINEVGNRSNDSYDWIELRNTSGSDGFNLRNYVISIVTSNSSDAKLIQFPANDNAKIAKDGVFLILASDPVNDANHPLATGYNVDKKDAEQAPGKRTSPVRYKVANFSLPNDGKFILIVRKPDNLENKSEDKKGPAELGKNDIDKIVDVAGWSDNVGKTGYPNSVSNTGVWPLHNFKSPFTNRNAFYEEKVHRRQYVTTNDGRVGVGAHENKNQDDRAAFRDVGWTGVGYRRQAAVSSANGGTPGYDNGALRSKGSDVTSSVYISEIMYADASGGTLPQWIELRNTSKTAGANLHNWRLTIVNHDSTDDAGGLWNGTVEATILLRDLKIKPNSSVLITSRKGPRSEVYLSNSDIFVLYPVHRDAFGMKVPGDDVINGYGFRILLQANAHDTGKRHEWQFVDEVGNLAAPMDDRRGNRERFDDVRWNWPNGNDEDGDRISVVRIGNTAGALDGTMPQAWVLSSSEDSRTDAIDYVYYGHKNDTSTPGQTFRSPLPVSLSYFRPTLENGEVVIRWTTESELDNAGFNILRSDSRNGEFKQVNSELVQGAGTTGERNTYEWVDETAKLGVVYYYQIEDVSFAGEHQTLTTTKLKGLISAKNKLTTLWGGLKEVQ